MVVERRTRAGVVVRARGIRLLGDARCWKLMGSLRKWMVSVNSKVRLDLQPCKDTGQPNCLKTPNQ